jgi:hypothetical protein
VLTGASSPPQPWTVGNPWVLDELGLLCSVKTVAHLRVCIWKRIPKRRSATVGTSWTVEWSDFKSPLRVVVQVLLRSREAKANKCRELKCELAETQRLLSRRERELEQRRKEIDELKQQVDCLEEDKRIGGQSVSPLLPDDPPIGTHGYGPRMVSLAVTLARTVGLRAFAKERRMTST